MSDGLDTTTTNDCGAATKFFLSDRDGARELREAVIRRDFSQRVRSIFSVQLELSCRPSAQGEWISLAGSSRDNLERAKDYILSCFGPQCLVELVSSIDNTSSRLPMAHAVHQHGHYDVPTQPPSLGSLSSSSSSLSCSVSSLPGAAGTAASLYSRSGYSLSPPPSYQSPSSCTTSSLEHQTYHHRHLVHVPPTTCTSPYHPPNIDVVRSIEEPTPTTSTIDSEEQLRNAIQQLPPEKLKNLLYATLASERFSSPGRSGQQQQKFQLHSSGAGGARAQHHGYDSGSVMGVGAGHRLLSRSPDQREKKIDYFVNTLNYPREKVESVLDQLGPDAANNDILERLVKVCRSSTAYAKPTPSISGVYKEGHGKYPPAGSGGMSVRDPIVPPSQLSPPLPMPPSVAVPAAMTVIDPARLRHIVIDGSNVAMRHGNGNFYSCRGIQLAVDYFRKRGHDKITVFVPEWRKETSKPETPIADQDVLYSLERDGVLKYTPSRRIRGKRVACYDDRFILDLAAHEDGVIVSNDQFRDLMDDKPEWREVIETRLLPFQFVEDYFMIPEDPMGKDGPTLDQMLAKNPKDLPGKHVKPSYNQTNKQICPYLEKCTFGRKCKFYHPERDQRNDSVAAGTPQSCMSPSTSRTPNTSRSTTPSPSPEKWVLSGRSNRSSGEDFRQLHSNNSSTDDLTHFQGGSGSGGMMDIAELMQGSLIIHDGSQQGPPQVGYFQQQRPVPPNSMNLNPPSAGVGVSGIHSAPVFTNTAESASSTPVADSQHLPHRYTFPMAVIPQPHHVKPSRTRVLTEHHHLSSTLPPPTAGGGATLVGGAGGGAFTAHGHDVIRSDPNVVYSLQPLRATGAASSGYAPSLHHQGVASTQLPSMFLPRDGWHYPPLPTGTATSGIPPPPHDMHPPHVPHSGSLMQAPAGFYPPSQGGQLPPQPPPPSCPPGYNSRAASNDPIHSHSVCSSQVSVPSTRTSPYHHPHQSHSIPQPQDLIGHRHHSIDYGHAQDVSSHRRRSYSSEAVHKQPNGTLPQVTSSPALMAAAAAGAGGGSPYNYLDYHQSPAMPPGTCSASAIGGLGRPSHGHQSATAFAQSTHHHMPSSSLPPSAPTHYNHRLPAVSERSVLESERVNWDLFQKMAALFPGFEERIMAVMVEHPRVLDIEELVRLVQQ